MPTAPARRFRTMSLKYMLATLAATSLAADGAITAMADSSTFDYLYEMDVNPSGQDLDSAGSATDWFPSVATGLLIPQTYSGGVASSNQANGETLFRSDFGGSISRQNLSSSIPYTIEFSIRKAGGAQGLDGWFGAVLDVAGQTGSTRINVEDDRISITGHGDYLVGNNFADGAFHTVRVAVPDSGNSYYWVDGVLLNADLSTPILDGQGSANAIGVFFLGDFSGSIAGDWDIDYIRIEDDGAFAPVPEPSSIAALALGAVALLRRRRQIFE